MVYKRFHCLFQCIVFVVVLCSGLPSARADYSSNTSDRILKSASELAYPPFAVVKTDGSADGFSVDLLRAVTSAIGLKVDIEVGPWSEIKDALEEGHIDVLPLVAFSEERAEVFDFTVPYLHMHGTVFVRKGEQQIQNILDLQGREVLVMKGDTAHEYAVRKNLSEQLILTESFEDAFKLLSQGEHDAVIVQNLVGLQLIQKLGLTNVRAVPNYNPGQVDNSSTLTPEIHSFGMLLPDFEQKFCIAVQKGESELLALLNEGLAIVVANGTYDALYKKWFAPILPPRPVSTKMALKYLIVFGVPVLFGIVLLWMYFLKREVNRKTESLRQEIRERGQIEQKLHLQGEIVKNMSGGAYLIRVRDGIIMYANPQLEQMFGYRTGEMVGQHVSIVNAPGKMTPEDTAEKIMSALKQDGVWQGEIQNIRKDGSLFWCWACASVFNHTEHGDVIVSVHSDITRQKQMEEEKDRLEIQLRQKYKMEAIGTLAAGIAHDFNNILSPIYGYAEFMQAKVHDNPQLEKCVTEVLSAAYRAGDLVKQILTFSRKSQDKFSPVDVQFVVREALKMLRATIPSTIEIRQQIDSGCGHVLGNSTQVHQVIMNLGTNAYHAMRKTGGALGVVLKPVEISSDSGFNNINLSPGYYLMLEVSDKGTGMDKETISRIFEPYFTTKEKGEGTGMGLSVVHGIIKNHGGDITVYSEPGIGTTFRVYLPCIEGSEPKKEEVAEEYIPEGSERILLVDDEASVAKMAKIVLEDLGYKVTVQTSPIEALNHFQEQPGAYDLIITDMTMPQLTGDRLAAEMLAIRPDVPVILCTGFSELINEEEALNIGVRRFLTKPFNTKEFAKVIRDVIDG